jgi:hypothetical protein
MATILQDIENWWGDAEADVVKFLAAVIAGEQAALSDIEKAQTWLQVNGPTILAEVEAVVAAASGVLSPTLTAEVQTAISLLSTWLASEQASTTTVASVANGLAAIAAVNTVKATAAGTVAAAAVKV